MTSPKNIFTPARNAPSHLGLPTHVPYYGHASFATVIPHELPLCAYTRALHRIALNWQTCPPTLAHVLVCHALCKMRPSTERTIRIDRTQASSDMHPIGRCLHLRPVVRLRRRSAVRRRRSHPIPPTVTVPQHTRERILNRLSCQKRQATAPPHGA